MYNNCSDEIFWKVIKILLTAVLHCGYYNSQNNLSGFLNSIRHTYFIRPKS